MIVSQKRKKSSCTAGSPDGSPLAGRNAPNKQASSGMDGSRLAAEPDEAGPSSGMNGSCLVAAPDKAGPSSEVTEDDDIAEVAPRPQPPPL